MDQTSRKFIKKFGLRMREIREKKGWTLEKAEEEGWPSWQHLQRIEGGHKNISLVTILKLSKLYKMNISDMFKQI